MEYTGALIRRHFYPQTAIRRPPFVLGNDVVVKIDQLDAGVSGFRLGNRVADMTVVGSNAAYRTLRASHLTRVPAGVDAEEAATLILVWTTAHNQLLHRSAQVRRGAHARSRRRSRPGASLSRQDGRPLELWGTARSEHATPMGAEVPTSMR